MPMNVNTITMTMSTARNAPATTMTTIITTMSTVKNAPAMSMSITMDMNTMNTTITTMGIMVMKSELRAVSG